jgi:hypothetical protein
MKPTMILMLLVLLASTAKAAPRGTVRIGSPPRVITVFEGDSLAFANDTSQPTQLASDCNELPTQLAPGQSIEAKMGDGPKTCHLADGSTVKVLRVIDPESAPQSSTQ